MSIFVLIGIIVAVVVVTSIILIMVISKNKNKNKEIPASILDVQNIGVSASDQEFSYGYEKEETIVMDPITNINESEKIENSNIENSNVQNSGVLNVSTDEAIKEEPAISEIITEKNEVEISEEIKSEENSIIKPIDEIEEIK